MTQSERRLFLIGALLKEAGEEIPVPAGEAQRRRLLRGLMNLRPPKEAPKEFLKIQDEYLKEEIRNKGVTDGDSLPFAKGKICLWQGDITTLKCGAIVNAANSAMLGCFYPCHGCIDNAVHTYAGVRLRLECEKIMAAQGHEEPIGRAKITGAYNLPCGCIIHTVGPIVSGELNQSHRDSLMSCYASCLRAAEERGIKSLAFCCVSAGEFRFPNREAAEIAVKTVEEYLKGSKIERVIFNVFKDKDRDIYEELLG